MCRSSVSRYVCPSLLVVLHRALFTNWSSEYIYPGVNARVSDAFDWIRASVCAMSDFPPADLCEPANAKELAMDWGSYFWHGVTVGLGVAIVALLVDRFWARESIISTQISTPDSSQASRDELEELTSSKHLLSKLSSYDSTGIEVT